MRATCLIFLGAYGMFAQAAVLQRSSFTLASTANDESAIKAGDYSGQSLPETKDVIPKDVDSPKKNPLKQQLEETVKEDVPEDAQPMLAQKACQNGKDASGFFYGRRRRSWHWGHSPGLIHRRRRCQPQCGWWRCPQDKKCLKNKLDDIKERMKQHGNFITPEQEAEELDAGQDCPNTLKSDTQLGGFVFSRRRRMTCDGSSSPRSPLCRSNESSQYLQNTDFEKGTVSLCGSTRRRISWNLGSNVEFNPTPSVPEVNSEVYLQGDGYFLGFFAAIAIEGNGISLNCQYTYSTGWWWYRHTGTGRRSIKMHADFHKRQRFFSVIELASRPFMVGTGPPPLAAEKMSPCRLRAATYVTINECELGLSSHHGIHGNNAIGVTIKNGLIKDFEVAGIALNGGHTVTIDDMTIGPSLLETFPASLSQALFLRHMTNVVGLGDAVLTELFEKTTFTLRSDASANAKTLFEKLNTDVDAFLTSGSGDLSPLLSKPVEGASSKNGGEPAFPAGSAALPDGSAIYGIVIHKAGPSVSDFGAHPDDADPATLVTNLDIKKVRIYDLKLRVESWFSFNHPAQPTDDQTKKQVQGPAGAVFRAHQSDIKDPSTLEYVGNSISDAQVAVQQVLKEADTITTNETMRARAAQYYDAAYIPDDVLSWTSHEVKALDYNLFSINCNGDAMSHANKGIVGLRLEFVKDPKVEKVWVGTLENFGAVLEHPSTSNQCADVTATTYKGNDVRGLSVRRCRGCDSDKLKKAVQVGKCPEGGYRRRRCFKNHGHRRRRSGFKSFHTGAIMDHDIITDYDKVS